MVKGLEFDGAGWDDDGDDMEDDDDIEDSDDVSGDDDDGEAVDAGENGAAASQKLAAAAPVQLSPVQAAETLLKYHGGASIEVSLLRALLRRRRPSHLRHKSGISRTR